ncbi:MAG: Chemotaxis protein methyltransferase Cher2 [Pseudomonadota bacterium]|jgi:chemotaxis protein methyltransferase CheR
MAKLLSDMGDGIAALSSVSRRGDVPGSDTAGLTGRLALVNRVTRLVESRFGIYCSGQVIKKLNRIFEGVSEAELSAWVGHLQTLPDDHGEWLSLVESLTVHETYFGRDRPMLDMLQQTILPAIVEQKRAEGDYRLRIWSAGCSTGEESFNLAMILLQVLYAMDEAVLTPRGDITPFLRWQIEIMGTDISRQALATARTAQYNDAGMGSFRDFSSRDIQRFFDQVSDVPDRMLGVSYYQTRPFVRRWVSFRQHNLLSGIPAMMSCDLVICRNVLIYFQDERKREVQQLFNGALVEGGVLLLGGSDVLYWPENYQRRFGDGGVWYIRK